jgi:RNA polymerase sigma factor (sigma-70 family)
MKITYQFAKPEDKIEIEVSDDIGEVIVRLDKDERNSYQRLHRYSCSLEAYDSYGKRLEADDDIESDYIESEEKKALYIAIATLLPQQRKLIERVYYDNERIIDIARSEGVSEAAIRDRLKKIYAQLRKKL